MLLLNLLLLLKARPDYSCFRLLSPNQIKIREALETFRVEEGFGTAKEPVAHSFEDSADCFDELGGLCLPTFTVGGQILAASSGLLNARTVKIPVDSTGNCRVRSTSSHTGHYTSTRGKEDLASAFSALGEVVVDRTKVHIGSYIARPSVANTFHIVRVLCCCQ